jgi:uncharacterized protein (UPF0335 family)
MSTNGLEGERLLAFIERVERLEEDKKTVSDEIKDVYSEAKGTGYDTKIVRKLIGLRKQDSDKRAEEAALLELYAEAIGMPG